MLKLITYLMLLIFGLTNAFFLNKPIFNFFRLSKPFTDTDKYEFAEEYYRFLNDFNIIDFNTGLQFGIDNPQNIIAERIENYKIFEKNYKMIQEFNQGNNSFKLDINQYADTFDMNSSNDDLMKNEINNYDIFKNDFIGIKQMLEAPQYYLDKYRNLSDELIWDDNIVSKVKNQARCGSCWAFSTTGAIEANMRINKYEIDRLSEQELVDCSKENHGCRGGLMHLAFDYCIENNGLTSNKLYNYTGTDGDCLLNCNITTNFNLSKVEGSNIKNYKFTIPRSVIDLKASLKNGPICIALDASPFEFRFYKEGIIDIPNRNNSRINHAVLLTGYSQNINGSYWIIQNSWGEMWGDNGYAKIRIKNGDGVLLSQLYGVFPFN